MSVELIAVCVTVNVALVGPVSLPCVVPAMLTVALSLSVISRLRTRFPSSVIPELGLLTLLSVMVTVSNGSTVGSLTTGTAMVADVSKAYASVKSLQLAGKLTGDFDVDGDAIRIISLVPPAGQARLSVWSDGPPLEKSVEAHLFEPFFSSESRSSGLGLYICRQLCERYGAQIGYQRSKNGTVQGNEFFVSFKLAKNLQTAALHSPDDLFA